MDLTDNSDNKDTVRWDTSPLTKTVWLNSIQRILQADKAVRELLEFGWVLVQSKTAVNSVRVQAKYLGAHPDVFFDITSPAPEFSVLAYETRRHQLIGILDQWHRAAGPLDQPPFSLQSYVPLKDRSESYSSTPAASLVALGMKADDIISLTDTEKTRFFVSPEVIAATACCRHSHLQHHCR